MAIQGYQAKLLQVLVSMEDEHASFQIMRLSIVSRTTFLLCTLPSSVTRDTTAEYDTLLECDLASLTSGEGTDGAGLAGPGKFRADPSLCR